MMIQRIALGKEKKEKKNFTFRFIRLTLGIGALTFIIAFFVTMTANNKKVDDYLLSAIAIPTYEPFEIIVPVDLIESFTPVYEDDAPILTAKPVMAQGLEWERPARGDVLAEHSDSQLVFNRTMNDWRVHLGMDFGGNIGSSVMTAADGNITAVGIDELWGNYIEITHADGYISRYCSLQANPPVKKGDIVTKGQIIGGIDKTASAEIADPPHLHFEILLKGKMIDPMDLF